MATTREGRAALVVGVVVAALVVPHPVAATVYAVTNFGDTGGFGQLRTLVNAAVDGDVIFIPPGTITLTTVAGGTISIVKSLTIQGAGAPRTIVDGGGIAGVFTTFSADIVISGLTIRNGSAFEGGGLFNLSAVVTLANVTVTGNSAAGGVGGGGIVNLGTLRLTNVTVSANTSAVSAGGIYNEGTLVATNSTISGNTANKAGGGLENVFGTTTLTNVTIANNKADNDNAGGGAGGGLLNSSTVTARNTIIAGNTVGTSGSAPDCAGPLTSQGYDLIQSVTGCVIGGNTTTNKLGLNPLLGPLAIYGGPTRTHALLPGSPAIDGGDPAGCPPTDQRGVIRPQDGNGNGIARCDIGAFEAGAPSFATLDFDGDGKPEIVVGAGPGGGPHVRVLRGDNGVELLSFFAYDPAFAGGVRVAVCDLNGDGVPDIVTAAGPGGGPHVRVFDGKTGTQLPGPVGSFFAYAPGFTGGVFVGCGDVNGDGVPDLITGPGPGGGPHVRVFSGVDGSELLGLFAFDAAFTGGVFVAP
jgi:FG-GAP-like repeat